MQYAKLKPIVMAVSFVLLLLSLSGLSMAFSTKSRTHFDFRTQYTAGYMVRTGHARQLYDYDETRHFQNEKVSQADKALPFIHLAYEALFYVPFSIFRYETAYFLFFTINLAFLAWTFFQMRPYLAHLAEIWTYLPVAIFVCFLPVTFALLEGQNSILLLALMMLILMKLERGSETGAGIVLGLASMKFQYVIPIVLLFTAWRRWRFLGGFAISAAIVVGVSIWLTGVAGFASYLHLLESMSAHFSSQNGMKLGIRPELMPNVRGLVYAISGGSSSAGTATTLVLSAGVFLWAAIRGRSFAVALLTALLVSYHETFTDASLLIMPIGLIAGSAKNGTRRVQYIGGLCAVIFIAPALLLLVGARFYLLTVPLLGLLFMLNDKELSPKQYHV